MKNRFLVIIFIFLFISWLSAVTEAAGATLYLSPDRGNFFVGDTFNLSMLVNTGQNYISAIKADLKFDPKKIEVVEINPQGAFISIWISRTYSNETGIISIEGKPPPPGLKTTSGLISKITFKAISPGKITIPYLISSKVISSDGKGTNILGLRGWGVYEILATPPEGPRIFFSTHPNPDIWYPDSNPAFRWEKEEGVNDFSWSLDQNPEGVPDEISEGDQNSTSFSNISDGIWYFHLRQKKYELWGKTSHFQIKIDTTSPEEFSTKIKNLGWLKGHQTLVSFETDDKPSGIDHYQLAIIDLSSEKREPSFEKTSSPYKVLFRKAGKYKVIVRAFDKAGNFRESQAEFEIFTHFISYISGKGFEIEGVLFPWQFIFIGIAILFGEIFFEIIFWVREKRKKF